MNHDLVDQVAAAILYEGYILYPYRPSVKNRERWTFGSLAPQAYSQAQDGSEPCEMRTECLVLGSLDTALTVSVRFLRIVARQVGKLETPIGEWPRQGEPPWHAVESLRVGEQQHFTWQEAVEQKIDLGESRLDTLISQNRQVEFSFEPERALEPLRDAEGSIPGVIVREHRTIAGSVALRAAEVAAGVFRVTVTICNQSPLSDHACDCRSQALLHGLASTHMILGASGGQFVSMMDPPESLRDLAGACRNVGCWPVLVGKDGETHTMLSAPIILYDYPQIAPESPGDLFDSTEIDEILTLRIMTLTEEEKRAVASVDVRARAMLERTAALGNDQFMGLHGTFRGLRPASGADDHA